MAAIIVPTDFSDNAYNALFYATRLFRNEVCKITLVHSFESQFSTSTSRIDIGRNEALYDTLEAETNKQFDKLKHRIILDSRDITLEIETVCNARPLYKMVNQIIIDKKIDFVAMGTKGASGLQKIFIGSQAVDLIKKIQPIPLFLVPQQSDFKEPKNIAFATDLKIDYSEYSLEIIKQVSRAYRSKLHIAHIYNQISTENTIESNYRKLKQKLDDVEYTTHWISSKKEMQETLNQFCSEHKIHLLVLMYHKYSFFKRLLRTSFVDKLSFESNIPLLIVPATI